MEGAQDFRHTMPAREGIPMAAKAGGAEAVFHTLLVNYLVSQARTVEASVNRAISALLDRNDQLAGEVFLTEPRVNEMEIVIDEFVVRTLRLGSLREPEIRQLVATLKINNASTERLRQ